jgi:hypothetical protein
LQGTHQWAVNWTIEILPFPGFTTDPSAALIHHLPSIGVAVVPTRRYIRRWLSKLSAAKG